ncbi:uncharacterized protein LOC119833878 [Zerene cesonia]|uniref:uncharacterized protein LOC119833878 n=1 Tax=Zerene cesonia TaxID=33412 RepID=UPI0018E54638|nr:uncharacterized protein LOC119833878 [Zerene cesonia]
MQPTQGHEITIDSLQDGPGLLPFKLGHTKIVSHYHSFLNNVNLADVHYQIKLVKGQLSSLKPKLNNKTLSLYDPHIEYLNIKLERISEQLQTFEPTRNKRGLIDGLGSVIKSISGNLDYTDAIKYNDAIKVLENNQHTLESELNSHISLNKEWTLKNSKLISNITLNQAKITKVLDLIMNSVADHETDLIKYAHLAQHLLILGDNIDRLSEEISKLENTLAFIRVSGAPHSILNIADLKTMLDKLGLMYSKDEILDLEIRYFYDIIKLGYFYIGSEIVLVYKIPIAFPSTYDLYKLSLVPNSNNQILLPSLPFIAISGDDSEYMEAECPKVNEWYICAHTSKFRSRDDPDCIYHLITQQELLPSCKLTTVSLTRTAIEQLDDKHYTVSFPNNTKVKTFCGQEQHRVLYGSYLTVIPLNCYIKTPTFTILNSKNHIKGNPLQIMDLPKSNNQDLQAEKPYVTLNSINLENLHSISEKISLQKPIQIEQIPTESLYHTTIPFYVVLCSIAMLSIGILYRKLCLKNTSNKTVEEIPIGTYRESSGRCQPHEIKVDHNNISATLSSNS